MTPTLRSAASTADPPAARAGVERPPFIHPSTRQPLDLSFVGAGGTCFIVLAGPSARQLDLSQLSRRGIYTFAVNNAATILRPNAWVHVDPPTKFHDSIWLDTGILKFCPSTMLDQPIRRKLPSGRFEPIPLGSRHMATGDCPAVVGYHRRANFAAESYLSEPFVNWGVSPRYRRQEARRGRKREVILNVMSAVLKIAYSLGFRRVFLIGCDFRMDESRPYSFGQSQTSSGVEVNSRCYRIMQGMFAELQPRFLAAGFHVHNCFLESGLTAFPFVDYDDAIRRATESVPQNPDPAGWYEKK